MPTWFSLGPQFGLKLNARFNHLGNLSSTAPGPATGGDMDRTYNDGFVESGQAPGMPASALELRVIQNSSQVQSGNIVMHATSPVNGSLNDNDDPQPGFDLAFGHDFGEGPGWEVGRAEGGVRLHNRGHP